MAPISHLHRQMLTPARLERFKEVAARRLGCLTVIFENIGDPHNINACLRSAEAFGLARVFVLSDEPYRPVEGVSMYANRWIEVSHRSEREPLIDELRNVGFSIVGTMASDNAVPLHALELPPKTALVMGNEALGLSAELIDCCDSLVTIPMAGFTQSLNISAATAICLEQLARAYRQCNHDVLISGKEQDALVTQWCNREVQAKMRKADDN
ncbi:MAG: RNA methyltransferase [Candidatus Pacebacteria bacterium]|nr:RNA methyltransferase [Candidatus Paceibacterota bacterium]